MRIMVLAALTLSACRRPEPENPRAWEQNPGLDPRPAGHSAQGTSGLAPADVTFRLDPGRGSAAPNEVEPRTEEEALYLASALKGFAWAQTKLGYKYTLEGDDLKRLGEGLRWLNSAAGQNDADALRILSALAAAGRGMDQSDKEAYKYMRRAAELGSAEAQYELAMMLANGRGMPRDMEAALLWGRKSAQQGFPQAEFSIGRNLLDYVERERKEEGLELIERAADKGNNQAVLLLGTIYAHGRFGLSKDEKRAEIILRPAAEAGNTDCQLVLASLYRYGEEFEGKRGEAGLWLTKAAEGGNKKAIEIVEQMKAQFRP